MRLIFMGTPTFSVPALEALLAAGHEVVAVYTQPPRPAGRGQKLTPSPVQKLAEQHAITAHSPLSLKDEAEQQRFAAYEADAAVVAAYGLLLPPAILTGTKHGCINIHPSLLPRWRGAAPIHRAVLAGDERTGVCIMQMDEGLDTGAVLMQKIIPIPPDATSGHMHEVLAQKGANLLLKTLDTLQDITPVPQTDAGATYAKKLTKAEAPLNWYHSAQELMNQVRGLNPFPLATMLHGDTVLKLYEAVAVKIPHQEAPGTVLDDRLTVACGNGEALRIIRIQKPGGKPTLVADFLNGYALAAGTKLVTSN